MQEQDTFDVLLYYILRLYKQENYIDVIIL